MRIEIELTEHDPPVGAVLRPDGTRIDFEGWLGLLRVLAEDLDGPASAAPPNHDTAGPSTYPPEEIL